MESLSPEDNEVVIVLEDEPCQPNFQCPFPTVSRQQRPPSSFLEQQDSQHSSLQDIPGQEGHIQAQGHMCDVTASHSSTTRVLHVRPDTDITANEVDLTEDDLDSNTSQDALTEEDLHTWITQRHETEMSRTSTRNLPTRTRESEDAQCCTRNLPVAPPLQSLKEFFYNGIRINPKANVELKDGDFMRIVDVIHDPATCGVVLRGCIFRRTREMNGTLDRKYNELCWILHVDKDDQRGERVQAMESVPISQVVRRRKIRMTNQDFPACSFREDDIKDTEETVLRERVLVCRYKYVCLYANAKAREQYTWSEKALHRLRPDECDPSLAEDDEELRHRWRGPTAVGGACPSFSLEEKTFLQHEYQTQCDLRIQAPNSSHGGSPKLNQRSMSMVSSPCDDDVIEIPKPNAQATKDFIDLTNGSLDSSLSDWPAVSSISDSGYEASMDHPGRESSPESVEIDATIRTTTRLGILQKRYEGRVTTSFITYPFGLRDCKRRVADTPKPGYSCKRPKLNTENTQPRTTNKSTEYDEYFANPLTAEKPCSRPACESRKQERTGDPSYSSSASSIPSDGLPVAQASSYSPSVITVSGDRMLPGNSLEHSQGSVSSGLFDQAANEQRYTLGDCFCGAGGVSRGAVMAGLRVEWAFDFNKHACASYDLNHYNTSLYPVWAHEFCNLTDRDHKVDICHLSPPCQFFSDAHTIMGKDDDMNTASLFAISELVKKAKPRVVTLEQTSGLLRRHEIYFNAVILMFTALGFSIRWRILNCADYGVPQRRMRIFMIASCPGEPLPPFPAPTHSPDPGSTGLKPWTTVNEAISAIPSGWPNHDLENARPRDQAPESSDTVAKCITTHGGGNIHPSGKRDLTDREFACLQTFPLEQKFGKTSVKKQIGNAVPPAMARAILVEVQKALMRADGIE